MVGIHAWFRLPKGGGFLDSRFRGNDGAERGEGICRSGFALGFRWVGHSEIPIPPNRCQTAEGVAIMGFVGSEPRFAGDSSSGRTTDSGSVSRGSNPLSPASGRSENDFRNRARRPVRLAAKDTALSRRRSRVRIPYGLPTPAFRARGAFVYRLGYHPFKVERRVRFPYALPLPRPSLFASPADSAHPAPFPDIMVSVAQS